jgi:hypothetical protein
MSTPATDGAGAAASDADLRLVLPGKRVPAGDGLAWIVQGWRLFRLSPLMWIVSLAVVCVAFVLLGLLQGLGALVAFFLKVLFFAGFMAACRELERSGSFDLEELLAGFRKNVVSLLVVALVVLVGLFVIVFATMVVMVFTVGMQILVQDPKDFYTVLAASGLGAFVGLLVLLALLTPLAMAYWFAPALIIVNGLGAFAAMKASFMGCLRNFIPFLVYGVLMTLLAFAAALPALLGFLVWIPVAVASTYAAYRAIFTDTASAPVATTV